MLLWPRTAFAVGARRATGLEDAAHCDNSIVIMANVAMSHQQVCPLEAGHQLEQSITSTQAILFIPSSIMLHTGEGDR